MLRGIFIFLLVLNTYNDVDHEQVAFDYFIDKILEKEFPKTKRVQFSGSTEIEKTSFDFMPFCFGNDKELYSMLNREDKNLSKESNSIKIDAHPNVRIMKRNSAIKLYVYKTTKVGELYYVKILVSYKREYTYAFFFEMNLKGEVLRWCKSEVIH